MKYLYLLRDKICKIISVTIDRWAAVDHTSISQSQEETKSKKSDEMFHLRFFKIIKEKGDCEALLGTLKLPKNSLFIYTHNRTCFYGQSIQSLQRSKVPRFQQQQKQQQLSL